MYLFSLPKTHRIGWSAEHADDIMFAKMETNYDELRGDFLPSHSVPSTVHSRTTKLVAKRPKQNDDVNRKPSKVMELCNAQF